MKHVKKSYTWCKIFVHREFKATVVMFWQCKKGNIYLLERNY